MKLEEAIEILVLDKDCEFEGGTNDLEAALQLGIEALKAQIDRKLLLPAGLYQPLPGETEE